MNSFEHVGGGGVGGVVGCGEVSHHDVNHDVYYRPQRSWAKVMFLHVSVILLTGGCTWSSHRGVYLVWSRGEGGGCTWSRGCTWQTPPRTRYNLQDQVHPPGPGTHPRLGTPLGPGTPPGTRYTPQDQVHPLGPGTPQDQVHPSGPGTPPPDQLHLPGTRYPPGPATPPSPGTPHTHPLIPPTPSRNTANKQPARILLECILV